LGILKSKDSGEALVDCQMRISVTDISIFKEFDTFDEALLYVRETLLDDFRWLEKWVVLVCLEWFLRGD
jgi:hypothetical protein